MNKNCSKWSLPLAFCLLSLSSPNALAQAPRPDQTYLQYQKTLQTATDISELNAFVPLSRQKKITDPVKARRMLNELSGMRKVGPLDVKIFYWKQSGDAAIVQATGAFLDSFGPQAKRETRWGYVKMIREDGQWKILNEDWLKEDLHLKPQIDKSTIAWCAAASNQAAANQVSTNTVAHGRLFNKEHGFVRAIFYPRHHCLDIYTHEEHFPPDHVKLSIQYPDSVCSINQIGVSKPGKTSTLGLWLGIELSRDASRVLNIFDNDDPYGLKVQNIDGESGPQCFINIRLPDAQHSYFCGQFPVEVWKYQHSP